MGDKRVNNGGKRANSGRKSKAEELGLFALLDKCWTEKDREACITELAKDCKSKDFHTRHESRKLLMAYAFGKPAQSMDLTTGGEQLPTQIVVNFTKKKNDGDGESTKV